MSVRLVTLAVVVATAAGLAACGKKGNLERPGPLFGATRPDTERPSNAQDPSRPVRTMDSRSIGDDATNPAPPRTVPIEGQPTSPSAPGPRGSLPDPYNNPQ